MTIDFLLTSLIIIVSPGTGVLYTLAAGLSRGSRASVVAAFGCTLGIVPHMAAAIMGLAAVLHTSALAFQTLKYLGVAYLLYMAWSALKQQGALEVERQAGYRSANRVIVSAVLINILNPKLSIFFFAFLPQFVSTAEADPLSLMLALSAVFMLLTFVVFVGYGLFAASVRNHVVSRPRVLTWMRRALGSALRARADRGRARRQALAREGRVLAQERVLHVADGAGVSPPIPWTVVSARIARCPEIP